MVHDDPHLRVLPVPGVLAVVAVVTVLLMGIASLQGVPQFGDILFGHRLPEPASSGPAQQPGQGAAPLADMSVLAAIASAITIVLALVAALLLGWLFWRVIRALWVARPLSRQDGAWVGVGHADPAPDEAVDAAAIRDAAVDAQYAIDAHPDPGDAIIAAWVHLEEASARAGRPRAAAETPGEFTIRILGRRPGLDTELGTLLGLYESVRFGGRTGDETERATARRCLAAIEEGWR